MPEALRRPAAALFAYFTRHPTAANLLMVVMLVAGLASAPQMRAQFFPDVVSSTVTVTVAWPGAGAEDVDEGIVAVLGPALLAVEGVASSTALAREGSASLTLEFEPGHDMASASEDIQTAIDAAPSLPEDAETPEIRRAAWSDRVTDVVISGPLGADQLGRLADEYVARLFAEGVTRTTIRGLAAAETVVEVSTPALMRHGLTMSEIATAIAAEARADPAGDVAGGAARVRSGEARRSPEDIAAIALRRDAAGGSVTIGDLAEVRALGADRNRALFVGDNPAVGIRVDRSADGDALGIQATAARVAAAMAADLPEGVTIELVRTRAEVIGDRLRLLLTNGAMGLALVVMLLFLFLNARTAFWVAAGIPVAMAAAIAAMYAMGLSFNMISLFALIITLGLVVDDAIVVGEHADWRARELGEGPAEAAERAATRMAQPVFAASITTVIAFLGLVAIGGRMGELIWQIPLTVIAVLVASLVECFLVLPHHMRHALASQARDHWYDWPSRQVNRGFRHLRERGFRPLMVWVVRLRYPVLAGVVVLLASQAALLIRGDVPWRFFAPPEQGTVTGNFAMLPGASRDDTAAMMREVQRTAERLGAEMTTFDGRPGVVHVLAEIGGGTGRGLSGVEGRDADLLGGVSIELVDVDFRPWSSAEFTARLQAEAEPHPALEILSFRHWTQGPGGDSLAVRLAGADTPTLKAAAEAVQSALAPFPAVSGLEDTLGYDKPELSLRLTPQGQALGFTVDGLSRELRARLAGIEAATFPDGPRSAAIRVELPDSERRADFTETMLLRSPAGGWVPLGDVVTVTERTGFSTIRRENGVRVVTVTGAISEDDPAQATEVMRALSTTILPDVSARFGVEWELAGQAEDERAFLSDAAIGFALCLLGIFLTLAWVFASWSRPLVVMAVIPFGLVGAVWGHWVMGVPLSMFSIVGLVGMAGIIINDSIVLVRTVDEQVPTRGLHPAIVDAACARLRPVLLTTLTTVLGLAPLLFERSSQAEFLKPTVITLVFGLAFGLVLVLLVVPALLAAGGDIARARAALRRARARRAGPAHRAVMGALAGVGGLFAVLVLPTLWPGAAPAPLPQSPGAAVALFLAGTACVCLAALALSRRRPA
ncbi:MAG: efflux RND transporter permease subunit [Alkalilacustris sp.]